VFSNEHTNKTFADWLVATDLEAARLGIKIHTCLAEPFLDKNYLDYARLTPFIADRFQVEVARFGSRQSTHCLEGAASDAAVHSGLVQPWCRRKAVMDKWERNEALWLAGDSRRFLCLAHGGFISLFRGGHAGMMPWDNDVDTVRCVTRPMREKTAVQVDQGDMTFRFRLFGRLEVWFSQFWLEHHFFAQTDRYGTLAVKMHWSPPGPHVQQFRPLRCDLHHTACVPSCAPSPTRCEFEDHFVHVDHWD